MLLRQDLLTEFYRRLHTYTYTYMYVCIVEYISNGIRDKTDDNFGLTVRGTVLQSRHNVLQQRGLGRSGYTER